ncbi:MAG: phage holin family protein [Hafnia sp.]
MTWYSVILGANAIICMAIVMRLMFFSKAGKTHRPGYAWMAYLLILSAGFTAFRILLGHYSNVDPGELFLNLAICIAVWRAKGNLAKVVRAE